MDQETYDVMADALVSRGLMTPEQVTADRTRIAELNGNQAGTQQPGKPDTSPAAEDPTSIFQGNSEEAAQLDAAAYEGPSSPAAYDFSYFGAMPEGVEHSPEQETAIRNMYHAEGIPVAIGNEIARLYNAGLANPPTPEQRELNAQESMATLHKMWGDNTDKNIEIANRELVRMQEHLPNIDEMLEASGLENNAWLVATLVNLAKARGRA